MTTAVNETHWNRFWKEKTGSRFTRKSWSKIRMMRILDNYVKPGMTVMDAGCGSGFFSSYFLSRGCSVSCLDFSEQSLALTRKATQEKASAYLREDLLSPGCCPGRDHTYDLIFTDGLFEHFCDGDQAILLNNFCRLKKDSGVIATFVPNKYSWWEVVRPIFMPGIWEKPFSPADLKGLHASLTILESGGLSVLPFRFSPEQYLGSKFGMILYCIAR